MTHRSTWRARRRGLLALLCTACAAGPLDGCTTAALDAIDDGGPPVERVGDAGLDAAQPPDAGVVDAGVADGAPPRDAGAADASPPDAAMDGGREAGEADEAGTSDGGPADGGGATVDAGPFCTNPPPDGGGAKLGPNDVTMLLPLPAAGASAVVATLAGPAGGVPLVPPALFTTLVTAPGDAVDDTFGDYQIIGARFDVCDRVAAGPCPVGADGRLRLVFQPVSPRGGTKDVGLHAFYRIPAAEMPCVVGRLRALAALADDAAAPLSVSPGALGPRASAYVAQLASLVLGYARYDNLDRFTMFTFDVTPNEWTFRGVQAVGGGFERISIPGVDAGAQTITTNDNAYGAYAVTPIVDSPPGFALAADLGGFGVASPAAQGQALQSLAQILNPLTTGISTLQCASCHIATQEAQVESTKLGVAEESIPGWYTAALPLKATLGTGLNFHMLGYDPISQGPVVSQRVANETAQVLIEIAQQFP